jgi:hypothetical protein
MDQFQGERRADGHLKAKYFFDENLWLNDVRGHDDCTNITDKFGWIKGSI